MKVKIVLLGMLLSHSAVWSDTNANLPVPPSGFDVSQSGIPHGTVTASVNYPTRNYGNRQFSIYLPPGYSASTRYPVLYLLHGIGGNQLSWIGQGSNEGTAQHVMDALYSRSLARPMIVVMPYGNMVNTTGDTWQNFEDVLINDLAPYIQANYSAATDAANRGLAGLSMGGGQTLNFGPKNSQFFNWIGAFSPAPNGQASSVNITNAATFRANVRFFWLSAGSAEPQSILDKCVDYHNFMMTNTVPHAYQLEPNLGHEKLTWNRSLYNFAQRIFTGNTGLLSGPPGKARAGRSKLAFHSGGLVVRHLDASGRWESAVYLLNGKAAPLKEGPVRPAVGVEP